MTKKMLIPVCASLLCVLIALPAMAKVAEREQALSPQAGLIDQFGMPGRPDLERKHTGRETLTGREELEAFRSRQVPLGAALATPGLGVGEIIDNTYNDIQRLSPNGKTIEHSYDTANGYVDVHFVYEEFNDWEARGDTAQFADPNKTGYNVWDANDSTWPWGQEAGCLIQSGDSTVAGYAQLDIMPSGLVVIGCNDNFLAKSQAAGWYNEDDGFLTDNHFYYQEERHSCFYDTGGDGSNSTQVPESLWKPGFMAEDSAWPRVATYAPSIAVQQIGNDTITHVVLEETRFMQRDNGAPSATYHVIKYFRKLGGSYSGTWEQPQVIDTNDWDGASICASRWGPKVAVFYDNINATGVIQDQIYDIDYFYRESENGGVDWGDVVNITQYRRDTISALGWYEVQGLYTSDNNLHLIFAETPTTMNPYRDGYFWGDFSDNLMHWADHHGTISKIAHGDYGIAANSQVCGWSSPNAMYIEFFSLGECDGNLYAVWNQIHHKINELGITDGSLDCSTDAERFTRANWEIFVSVSSSMDGLLWDAPRNLTDTYKPGCDSATGTGGPCGSEYKPNMEKYGLNEAGLNLKWPEKVVSDPDTIAFGLDSAYDGDYFLNVMYLDDEYPGSWYTTGVRRNDVPRFNALKWLRVACVNPIPAPQIAASPASVSWTETLAWVKNGEADTVTVTVTNDGNEPLDVFTIGTYEGTGSGWLSTSDASLAVPAGVPNTATFDVIVDASALAYGLGNAVWLDGEVYLKSDAGNIDSLSVMVHFLAADTVPDVNWDTVATSTAWDPAKGGAFATGDNIALAVSNFGEVGDDGMNGNAEANLDFFHNGGECRTDDRGKLYAWGGSPFIMQHDGGGSNLRLTTSFVADDQSPDNSFDPLVSSPGLSGGVSTGGEYDSVYTGPFADRDTAVILERTFYAPRNNPDNPSFMVCKTVVYSGNGQAQDNLTIGSFTDWDIPSAESPDNDVGTSAPASPAGQFVYARGTDVDTNDVNLTCQVNANRYGTELFLDWHTNTEYNLDVCAANDTTWGSWGARQGIAADTAIGDVIEPNVQRWYDSISVKQGVFASDTTEDQSIWVTYLFDHSVGATDTLTFYSVFATLHDGSLSNFENNLVNARSWYLLNIRGAACATCCTGTTMGNVDCEGIVDIGDVTEMIALLFIRVGDPFCCEDEADLDYNGDIDIGDLTILINKLFITVTDPPPCP